MHRLLVSLAASCSSSCSSAPAPAVAPPRPADCGAPLVLAGQDDVVAGARCTRVPALTLRSADRLDVSSLPLQTVAGDVTIGPSVGLEEVTLPSLAAIAGTLHVAANSNLHGLYLPYLARAGAVDIDGNASLATISLPRLAEIPGALTVTANPSLELLDLSALAHAGRVTLEHNNADAVIEGDGLNFINLKPPHP